MNKRKEQWLRISNRMLTATMTLLGFTSCGVVKEPADEYGTPYARFEIKGNVVDDENNGIGNGRVILKSVSQGPYIRDTLATASDGTFDFKIEGSGKAKYRVIGEDLSGTYRSDSVEVEMEPQSGDGWYQGSDMKEVTIQLKKKQDAE